MDCLVLSGIRPLCSSWAGGFLKNGVVFFLGQVGKIEELETGSRFFLDSTGTGFEVARTQVMTNVVQCNLFQGFSGLQEVGSRQENFGVRRINVEASTGRTICDPYSPVFIQRHTWVTNNYSIW